jgi:hypothetical protein
MVAFPLPGASPAREALFGMTSLWAGQERESEMEPMTTHHKALDINLDTGRYGSFAEIGASQEVARWFFRVGGAAGTIAKTISAYDKKVSDTIYGTNQRYVSSGRLLAMLEKEYALNVNRLDQARGQETSFFAFADTVSAQNYLGTADCHGWMGIRFQAHPRAPASQIILHARMFDRDALMQHEALGILGVNLVYGASRLWDQPNDLMASLLDNLSKDRISIDTLEFSGDAFANVDQRLIGLSLVELGFCTAAMFSADGEAQRPSEILYKCSVILQRGRFRPPTKVHADIRRRVQEQLSADSQWKVDSDRIVSLCGINLSELRETTDDPTGDFLERISALTAGNHSVLVSDSPDRYFVVDYLARFGARQIALPIGIIDFIEAIREEHFTHLRGGVLEAIGRLIGLGGYFYVYPGLDPKSGRRIDLASCDLAAPSSKLVEYLVERGYARPLEGLPDDELRLGSDDVLAMLHSGNRDWESRVEPDIVVEIKSEGLFGYKA